MTTFKDLERDDAGQTGFYVIPKRDCPHVQQLKSTPNTNNIDPISNCEVCTKEENWVCLHCSKVLCSRYVNSHMYKHCKETDHHLLVSLTDFSCWCVKCDSYIKSNKLIPFIGYLHGRKFGITMPTSTQDIENEDEVEEKPSKKNNKKSKKSKKSNSKEEKNQKKMKKKNKKNEKM